MKRFIIILIWLQFIYIICFAHDNNYVHQKIIIEAYKLLKLQLSKESNGIADIDSYIGIIDANRECSAWYARGDKWYECGTLTAGADQEDENNLVYSYKLPFIGDAPYLAHFWNVDDYWKHDVRLWGGGYFKSLFIKSQRYMDDDFTKIIYDGISGGHCTHYCTKQKDVVLSDYYWKETIYVKSSFDVLWYRETLRLPPCNSRTKYFWDWDKDQANIRKLFFNVVGRVCHLLMDCGVPEHIKRSYHSSDYSAPLEHWLRDNHDEFYWTADKVYKERGGFVNPFCELEGNKNLFLYYTTAQLSDRFACYGHLPKDGNTNFYQNVGEVLSILNSYFPEEFYFYNTESVNVGGFGQMYYSANWNITNSDARKMRDALLPYTIRAVAGMLYKYIIEAKMQYQNTTSLSIGSVYDQQQELNLFNQDISGDYYTFRAEGTPGRITVCPESRPPDYPADFVIGSRARNVTFRAAKEIIFKPGFVANQGAQVHAYLNCNCNRNNQPGNCKECLDEDYNPQYNRSIEQ